MSWQNLNQLVTGAGPNGFSVPVAMAIQSQNIAATSGYYSFGFTTQFGQDVSGLNIRYPWAQIGIYSYPDDRDLMNAYGSFTPTSGLLTKFPCQVLMYSTIEPNVIFGGFQCSGTLGTTCVVKYTTSGTLQSFVN